MSEPDEQGELVERVRAFNESQQEPAGTWPVKRELAAALRELLDCVCATDAGEEELLETARQVRATARRFADAPVVLRPEGVAEAALAGMETFHDRSPLVGLSNPIAPPMVMVPDAGRGQVAATVTFGSAYEGAPGCVHGGFVAAAFDEVLGMACIFSGQPGMTAELVTRYRKPTPTHTELRLTCRFDGIQGRKITCSGELFAGDRLVAEATGLFISIDRGKFDELQQERERRGR